MMDPIITPLILGGLGAAGITGTAASVIGGILSFVIVAGISIGLYLITAPAMPKPEDGKLQVEEEVPPRNFVYGSARVAGSIMLKEVNFGGGGNLGVNVALASHQVKGFRHIFLNDDEAFFDEANTKRVPTDPNGEFVNDQQDGRYGNDRVKICVRFGTTPEVWTSMVGEFGISPLLWNANCRGDAIAQLAMVCRDDTAEEHQRRFPYGAPNPSAVVDGYHVYDPRDPAQNRNNPATWKWSKNPVLAILHFHCFSEFGFDLRYNTAILPIESEWEAEADICDEDVPCVSVDLGEGKPPETSIKRYELGGQATTANDPKEVLREMLLACDGWMCRRGDGSIVIRVGKFRPSGIVITDDDIIGYQYQRGISDEEAVNRIDVQFTSKDHDWSSIECDPWNWDEDQTARGRVRETVMNMLWVQDYRQARRIAKRELHRQKEPLRGVLNLRLSAINAVYERWIYVQSTLIPALNNRYIENRAARFTLAGETPGIRMEFMGADADIDDWGPPSGSLEDDEGRKPPDIEKGGIFDLLGLLNVVAVAEQFTVGSAPSEDTPRITAVRLKVSWDKIVALGGGGFVPEVTTFRIRWRVKDTTPGGDVTPGDWTEEVHTEKPKELPGVPPAPDRQQMKTEAVDQAYLEVQATYTVTGGTLAEWSFPMAEVDASSGGIS